MEFQYQVKTPVSSPIEYGTYALESTRRKAGNDLYKLLYSQKLPAVVDIEESSAKTKSYYSMEPYLGEFYVTTIKITVSPVRHQHIAMAHVDELYKVAEPGIWHHLREIWKILTNKDEK